MRLIVRSVQESPFLIEVDDSMTIADVKDRIYEVIGIQPRNQTVILRGHILPERLSVAKLRLADMGTIFLYRKNRWPARAPIARRTPSPHSLAEVTHHQAFVKALRPNTFHFAHLFRDEGEEAYASQGLEYHKYLDRLLANIEGKVRGSRLLEVEYAALSDFIDALPGRARVPTVLPEPLDRPSTAPLPRFFGSGAERMKAVVRALSAAAKQQAGAASLLEMALQFLSSAEEVECPTENLEPQPVFPQIFYGKGKRPRPNNQDSRGGTDID